jgi:aryl-alcohol dehydrogenase-like predicted oxidoreductase
MFMKYNRLGRTGLHVSQLALGTMTFGDSGDFKTLGGLGQRDANALTARAFEAGVNLFDTADHYSHGGSEEILGEALRNLGVPRESYLIATKGFGPMGKGPNDMGASRAHLLDAAKASLKRLGVDHVDLYQVHGFDAGTPIEESLRALDDLVRQGHVRYVGVSNWAAWQVAVALGIADRLGITRLAALQAHYSLVGRDLEHEIAPLLASEGVGLLIWSPLASGFLSGKERRGGEPDATSRRSQMQFPPFDKERGFDILDTLRPIAEAHGATVAQVALAWLLHQPTVSSVLVGAKRMDQLDDNLKAVEVTLGKDELAAIDAVSRPAPIYPGYMIELQTNMMAEASGIQRS